MIFSNAERFVGQWKEGKVNGEGTINKTNGETIKKSWKNNKYIKNEEEIFQEMKPSYAINTSKI